MYAVPNNTVFLTVFLNTIRRIALYGQFQFIQTCAKSDCASPQSASLSNITMANQDQSAGYDELNHENDLGRSFQKPNRPSFDLSRGSSSFNEHRPMPADEHDGYSAVKYYSTFQEPGKQQHATHGSAGDLAALDQVEDPQRTATTLNRPQSASAKPGRSDVEERLEDDPKTITSSTTTSSYSVKPGKGSA